MGENDNVNLLSFDSKINYNTDKRYIKLPYNIFKYMVYNVSSTSVLIYMFIYYFNHTCEYDFVKLSNKEICNIINIDERNTRRHCSELKNHGLLYVEENIDEFGKIGKNNYLSMDFNLPLGEGYIKISYSLFEYMVNNVSPTSILLYMFIKYRSDVNYKNKIKISIDEISDNINKGRTTIKKCFKELEKYGLIEVDGEFLEKNTYATLIPENIGDIWIQ